jgi:aminoglycoside 3-N-acetyltransferase
MSLVSSIYNGIVKLSPTSEVLMRMLYWKNVEKFNKFSPNKSNRIERTEPVTFDEVLQFLSNCGIGKGSLIVLHSSFDNIKPIDVGREELINRLLEFIGEEGTLAAPVIRRYKECENLNLVDLLNDKESEIKCVYDVQRSKIISGVLAFTLMHHEGSVTSRHPLNPLTAVGPLAASMMEHNLEGEAPSPHGPNSCWKFCADHDAYIVHLGVNFGHHLTMQHVVTECNPSWDVKDFYLQRRFVIKDGDYTEEKTVSQRRQRWTMYIPEINNRNDLVRDGVAKVTNIKGFPLSVIRAKDLIQYYQNHRNGIYPYLFPFGKPIK